MLFPKVTFLFHLFTKESPVKVDLIRQQKKVVLKERKIYSSENLTID